MNKLLAISAAALLAFCSLSACGNTDGSDDKPVTTAFKTTPADNSVPGQSDDSGSSRTDSSITDTPNSKIPSGRFRYITTYDSDIEMFLSFDAPQEVTMEFSSDGTATLNYFSDVESMTFDDKNVYLSTRTLAYTFDGTNLTLSNDKTSMVFIAEDAYSTYNFADSIYTKTAYDCAKAAYTALETEITNHIADGETFTKGVQSFRTDDYDENNDLFDAAYMAVDDYDFETATIEFDVLSSGKIAYVLFYCNGFSATYAGE